MNDEVKIVNELDRSGHYFKIGVNADGQIFIYIDDETKVHHGYHLPDIIRTPKELELDGELMLQLPIDYDVAIDQGIRELKQR